MIITQEGTAPGPGGFTTAHPGDSDLVPSIEAMSRKLVETVDVEALAALYAEDALQIGEYAPGLYHGISQIRKHLAKTVGVLKDRAIVGFDVNVTTNGNLAVSHGQQTLAETHQDGTVKTATTRFHNLFRRTGGGWTVLMQHTSFVANLQTQSPWPGGFIKPGILHWDEAPFPSAAIDMDQAKYELNLWQIDDVRAQTADQAMHYYGPGDYTTVYDSRWPAGRMVGMWDVYQGWLPQMQLKHVEEKLAEFRVWTDGQFACHFTLGNVDSTKLDGSEMHSQFRQTDCLHRVDGQWYSYVESVSFPFDPSTQRLAINLPQERIAVNQ